MLVRHGRIETLGAAPAAAHAAVAHGARDINGAGTVCLPGLVNCHNHVAMTLLRGHGADLPLQRWLEEAIWPAEARMSDPDVLCGALLGCVEMARGGITAFADMYDHMDAVAEAVRRVGLRASLSRGVIGQGRDWEASLAEAADFCRRHGAGRADGAAGPGSSTQRAGGAGGAGVSGPGRDAGPADMAGQRSDGGDAGGASAERGLITTMLAPHAEYTCPLPLWERAMRLARELDVPMHTHVAETAAEVESCRKRRGCSPVRFLYEVGAFDVGVLAAHCVHVDAHDIALLARGEVAVSHNPVSNAKLGSGVAPLEELRAAGIVLGIGSDGAASTNTLGMWRELRAAAWLQKATRRDAAAAPVDALLRMATAGGAAALRLPAGCGRLEPGAPADLILVDATGPRHTPHPDLAASLLYGTEDADVVLTMVAGQVVMERGEFPGIDHERLRAEAEERSQRLLGTS